MTDLKLYYWDNFLSACYSGRALALAGSIEMARKMIKKKLRAERKAVNPWIGMEECEAERRAWNKTEREFWEHVDVLLDVPPQVFTKATCMIFEAME